MIETLIWRLTGWVCPAWSKRDNEGRMRYWNALVAARYALYAGRIRRAEEILQEALKLT